MKFLAACLFTMTVWTAAIAEVMQSSRIATLEAGVLCSPPTIGSAPAPGTIAGKTHIIADDPEFVATSRRVPALLGIGFGVKSQAFDPDGIADVTIRLSHPEMGEADVTMQSFATSIGGTGTSLTFYQFDHSYELVKGTWEFAAYAGEEQLYAVTFEVVDPQSVPELAGVCGFLDLLA